MVECDSICRKVNTQTIIREDVVGLDDVAWASRHADASSSVEGDHVARHSPRSTDGVVRTTNVDASPGICSCQTVVKRLTAAVTQWVCASSIHANEVSHYRIASDARIA